MATTKILPLDVSPNSCILYCESDKPDSRLKRMGDAINYAVSKKHGSDVDVIYHTLNSYHNCVAGNTISRFAQLMRNGLNKLKSRTPKTKSGKERVAYHFVQSFYGHETDPATANEIGLKLAKEVFKDFAVIVSTHTNTDDIHNHFVICAWNINGGKWDDCRDTKRLIRKTSDKLCEKYGLSVLDNSRDMILKDYVDKNGVRRSVEITERKMQKWQEYRDGLADIANANDYRHSDAYKMAELKKQSNVQSVKADIDNLLNFVTSYDELLSRMKDLGYTIKGKTSSGSWRKHITFVPPGSTKGTRDSSIGDELFYTRENLVRHIERNNNKSSEHEQSLEPDRYYDDIKYIKEFEYGKTNIKDMDNNYLIRIDKKGKTYPVHRSNIEKIIIGDIKRRHSNIGLTYNSVKLKIIIDKMKRAATAKKPYIPKDKNEKTIAMIRSSFDALNLIQDKGIKSHEDLTGRYKAAYDHRNNYLTKFRISENKHNNMVLIASLPEKITELEKNIEYNDSSEYRFEQKHNDIAALKNYKSTLTNFKKQNKNGLHAIEKSIQNSEQALGFLKEHVELLDKELDNYELCFDAIKRADNNDAIVSSLAYKEFENVRKERSLR